MLLRNAKAALIPVASEVDVIDAAPLDEKAVQALDHSVSEAVKNKNYPTARLLLYSLESEIRTRTYNLPAPLSPGLAGGSAITRPRKRVVVQAEVSETAINLVAVDKVTPIPLVLARAAIAAAEEQRQKDKNVAQTLLATAKDQLHRCQELGYAHAICNGILGAEYEHRAT